MGGKRINHEATIGQRFSGWTLMAVERRGASPNMKIWYQVRCECGTEGWRKAHTILDGTSKGCNRCQHRRIPRNSVAVYGCAQKRVHLPEYAVWKTMLARCFNEKNKNYRHYGARGIRVCDAWLDYTAFIRDMGRRPSPTHSLERVDNDGHYEPGNVRWATRHEQSRNKRNTRWVLLAGERLCQTDAALKLGISLWALRSRMRRGTAGKLGVTEAP